MQIEIRYLFTYWTLAWFIIYYIAVTVFESKYIKDNFNPLLITIVGAVLTAAGMVFMLATGAKLNAVTLMYVIMNLITKGIPIYLLRNTTIDYPRDSLTAAALFALYYTYLVANGKTLYSVYHPIYKSVLDGTYHPIILKMVHWIAKRAAR